MPIARFVLFLLGLSLYASYPPEASGAGNPVVRVGILAEHPPYAVAGPHGPIGFEVDLITALGEVMGFTPEISLDDWTSLRQSFVEGRLDVLAGAAYGADPALAMVLTAPRALVRAALVTFGPDETAHGLKNLDGQGVLVVAGDLGSGLVLAESPNAKLVMVGDAVTALRQLAAGRQRLAVLGDGEQGGALIAGLGLSQLHLHPTEVGARPVGWGVSQRRAELAATIDTGLAILRGNGRYQALRARWFGPALKPVAEQGYLVPRTWVVGGVIALVLTVLGLALRHWRLVSVPIAWRADEGGRVRTAGEQRFRAIFEAAGDAILVLDRRGVLDANPRALDMFGHPDKEVMRRLPLTALSPAVQANGRSSDSAFLAYLEQAQTDGVTAFEWMYRKSSGEVFPAEVQLSALDLGGARVLQATIRDITARKWTEAALRDSERRMSDIITLLPDPTLVIDRDGRIQFWNRAMEDLTGVRADQMLGKGDYEYAIPFYGERRPILIDLVRLGEHEIEQKYTTIKHTNGTLVGESYVPHLKGGGVYVIGTAAALYDSRGECVGAIELVRDITERRRAETALLESERRLAHIIDFLPDATLVIDRGGKIITWNKAMAEMTAVPASEMLGRGNQEHARAFFIERRPMLVDLVLYPDPVFEATYDNFERTGDNVYGEIYATALRGQKVYIMGAASVLRDSKGQAVGAIEIVRDLTGRKEVEEAMRRAKEAAESATRAKSEFLANMSHEIRTPMNAIIGMTSLLLDTPLTAEQRELSDTIRMSGDSLLSLINDILDFSKIEAGRMDLEAQPFDLRQCLEGAVDLVAVRVGGKSLDLGCLIEDGTPPTVIGDVTRVRQILVNLLNNGIKFTEQGEVMARVAVTELVDDDDLAELHFSVRDTGIGIPPDRVDRLFKSFSQVDASTTRRFGGTGLGLAISRRLAEIMGGRMWVESTGVPGRGATFHFTIRARVSNDPLEPLLLADLPELAGKRVMIVDDNQTNGLILTRQTQGWGMRSETFESPLEALETIRRGVPFDLAILDMQMPDMDGIQLGRAIRKVPSAGDLPLIMLTSLGRRDPEADAVGFAAFLNKPIKSAALHDALRLALGGLGALAPQLAASGEAASEPVLGARHPLRILVAEDYAINQKVALYTLAKMGYRADVASNGREALEALRRQPYDTVLMDVQMPEMDGLEATRRIVRDWPPDRRPRIIAMTANALQGDRELCLDVGMDDYISKPVQVAALQAALLRCPRRADPDPAVQSALEPAAVPAVDRTTLLEFFPDLAQGEATMFTEMVGMLLEDVPPRLDALETAMLAGQADQVHLAVHTLKSGCRSFGALPFAERCQEIETAARAGTLPDRAAVAALRAEFARVVQALCEEMKQ